MQGVPVLGPKFFSQGRYSILTKVTMKNEPKINLVEALKSLVQDKR